eukprot:COSAG01_NODE_179_length_22923_cov_25.190535_14_plen_100_part_00
MAGTNWEGGIRTPTFVCGGFLGPANRGKELFGLVHVADWFAVFSRWARPDGSWRVDARAEQTGLPAVSAPLILIRVVGIVASTVLPTLRAPWQGRSGVG